MAQVVSNFPAGPFGFYYGETKAQAIAAVGRAAIKKDQGDTLSLTSAPKPHKEFEEYLLIFSPNLGLLKIVAVGKTIENDTHGSELRSRFSSLEEALVRTYGQNKELDFIRSGSLWTEANEFMMSLAKKERTLTAYWIERPLPNNLKLISLDCLGLSRTNGYIDLVYEFKGWDEYVDSKEEKENGVL